MLLKGVSHTLFRFSNMRGKSGISDVGKWGVWDFLTWRKFLNFWEYFCNVGGYEHIW